MKKAFLAIFLISALALTAFAAPVSAKIPTSTQYNRVALVPNGISTHGGGLPTSDSAFTNFTFTDLPWANVTAGNLTNFDIVVLLIDSDKPAVPPLTPSQASDLNAWVNNGGKLIIYDSEETTSDYSWLIYPFNTSAPGAQGAHSGVITSIEPNTLGDNTTTGFYYINTTVDYIVNDWQDAIGDCNVFTTFDAHWCGDIQATNALQANGWVHAYARDINGLIIYNGFDIDYLGTSTIPSNSSMGNLAKIFLLELAQPWADDYNLPCGAPVVGNPAIAITKVANVTQAYENELIQYTFNISNIGNTPLFNVNATDNILGDLTGYISNRTIGVGEYRAFNVMFSVPISSEWINNTVTAKGYSPTGLGTNGTANASVEVIHPDILITKIASYDNVAVHSTIYYTLNVTNTGDTPLYNVEVIDNVLGNLTGQLPDRTLSVGESNVFVVPLTLDTLGWHNNTVTAVGYDGKGMPWTSEASESVIVIQPVGGTILPVPSIGANLIAILLSITIVALVLYKGVFFPKGRR